MKSIGMEVAPSATSVFLLSKSNCAASPIVSATGERAIYVPDFRTARYCPLARFEPSTDALERAARFSQRTSTSAAAAAKAVSESDAIAAAATSFLGVILDLL
jgi:hypothetical protein